MLFIESNDARLALLRAAIPDILSCAEGIDAKQRYDIADYKWWGPLISIYIGNRDYEGAWHRIQLALLGEKAFAGPDRIYPDHVEGEPVGFPCSIKGGMGLIHQLYYEMTHSGIELEPMDMSYGHDARESIVSGARIYRMMARHKDIRCQVAAPMALAIAHWVKNCSRLDRRDAA